MWPRLHAAASCFSWTDLLCGTGALPSAGPEILTPDAGQSLSDELLSGIHRPECSPGRWCLWSAPNPAPETCAHLCQLQRSMKYINRPVFNHIYMRYRGPFQTEFVSGEILPSVFCMIRSTRMGYFVMRWVTNRRHSGIPNLRTRGSWPNLC